MSQERLCRLNDETLVYTVRRPTPDGRTELILTPLELLDRLAHLLTPPRIHKHRYYGVLAPNAGLRRAVTETAGPEYVHNAAEMRNWGSNRRAIDHDRASNMDYRILLGVECGHRRRKCAVEFTIPINTPGCFEYYHEVRTHLGLSKDSPTPREVEPTSTGDIVAEPMVGGLHHRYYRKTA